MSFHVVALPCGDEETWAHDLLAMLEAQEAEGYGLIAMATRSAAVPGTGGMGAVTHYETQLVLVFQGDEGL